MPTYNRADTIIRAIASVKAQSETDWELIVVDDGSTDGTADLIAAVDPRMVLIRQENQSVRLGTLGFTIARQNQESQTCSATHCGKILGIQA